MAKNIVMCTATGEQHGLINTLPNSVPFDDFKSLKPEIKAEVEKLKKEESKRVKVRYINSRGRHERLTKHYCRYAGDPIETWHLIPSQEYEVPYGLVKEINGTKQKRRSGLMSIDGNDLNKDGSPLAHDTEDEPLHQLVPVSFF